MVKGIAVKPNFSFFYDCLDSLQQLLLEQPVDDVLAGRYRLVKRLGHGGANAVYQAMDTKLSTDQKSVYRAVKLIRQDTLVPQQADRLISEASALKVVSGTSDSFIQIHDVDWIESGDPYIVMEFVPGITVGNHSVHDLQSYLDVPLQVSRRQAVEIIHAISSAMDLIHRTQISPEDKTELGGLAHGDLKPSNILLAPIETARNDPRRLPFRPKIADFGVGAATETYMSPEQMAARGVATSSDDIWAIGIILSQLVTGKIPIRVAGKSLEEWFDSQSVRLGDPDLTQICRRCLDFNPKHRYQAAGTVIAESAPDVGAEPLRRQSSELTEALTRWLEHKPLREPLGSTSPARAVWLFARRNAVATIATILLMVTCTAALMVNSARMKSELLATSLDDLAVRGWMTESDTKSVLSALPSISQIAERSTGRSNLNGKRVAAAVRTVPRVTSLFLVEGNVTELLVSPDGVRLLAVDNDIALSKSETAELLQSADLLHSRLHVWSLNNPDEQHLTLRLQSFVIKIAVDWQRDRAIVVGLVGSREAPTAHLFVYDLSNGEVKGESDLQRPDVSRLELCNDGTHFLLSRVGSVELWAYTETIGPVHVFREAIAATTESDGRSIVVFQPTPRRHALPFNNTSEQQVEKKNKQGLLAWPGKAFGGNTPIIRAVSSPDGKHLALLRGAGTEIELWNGETLKARFSVNLMENPFIDLLFSPDSRWLLAMNFEPTGNVWPFTAPAERKLIESRYGCIVVDVHTGRMAELPMVSRMMRRDPYTRPYAAPFPDGGQVLIAVRDIAGVWRIPSRDGIAAIETDGNVLASTVFPDGWRIALAIDDSTVRVYDLAPMDPDTVFLRHAEEYADAAISAGGDRILTVAADGECRCWNTASGSPVGNLLRPALPSSQLKAPLVGFTHDGTKAWIFSCSKRDASDAISPVGLERSLLTVVNSSSGELVLQREGVVAFEGSSSRFIPIVEQTPEGSRGFIESLDGSATETAKTQIAIPKEEIIRSVACTSQTLFALTENGEGEICWYRGSQRERLPLKGAVLASYIDAAHSTFATLLSPSLTETRNQPSRASQQLHVWDFAGDRLQKRFAIAFPQKVPRRSLERSPDGRLLAISFEDGEIRIVRTNDGSLACDTLRIGADPARLLFSADGQRLLAAGRHGRARLFEVRTGNAITGWLENGETTLSVAQTDGDKLVTFGSEGAVRRWHLHSLPANQAPIDFAIALTGRGSTSTHAATMEQVEAWKRVRKTLSEESALARWNASKDQSIRLARAGNWPAALHHVRHVLSQRPLHATDSEYPWRMLQAECLAETGMFDEAIGAIQQPIQGEDPVEKSCMLALLNHAAGHEHVFREITGKLVGEISESTASIETILSVTSLDQIADSPLLVEHLERIRRNPFFALVRHPNNRQVLRENDRQLAFIHAAALVYFRSNDLDKCRRELELVGHIQDPFCRVLQGIVDANISGEEARSMVANLRWQQRYILQHLLDSQ